MSKFWPIFLILWSVSVHAECKKVVDPSKVIIFIDMNLAGKEIPTAEAGACERGERLVIIPQDYKKYDLLIIALQNAQSDFMKCVNNKLPTTVCDVKAKKLDDIGTKLRSNILDYSALLTNELAKLKKSRAVVTSFIISGHDGGGNFGGEKGGFDRTEIEKVFKNYPEVNKVESALLLGCYTGVKYEVINWRSIFPSLRLVGGYDSSAPLADKPPGLEYIRELLTNEKILLTKTDQKQLAKTLFSTIKSINELHAGIYIKTQCSLPAKSEEFYYGSLSREKGLAILDVRECQKPDVLKEIKELEPQISRYNSGELDPPKDSAQGEIRKIYNRARKIQHCLSEDKSSIDMNAVFNLLFFNGVKDSFASFYKEDLKKAEVILKDYNIFIPTAENLKNKTRKQILNNIYAIHALGSKANLPSNIQTTLSWLGKIMNQHFVSFQNPFSWHELTDKVETPSNYSALIIK